MAERASERPSWPACRPLGHDAGVPHQKRSSVPRCVASLPPSLVSSFKPLLLLLPSPLLFLSPPDLSRLPQSEIGGALAPPRPPASSLRLLLILNGSPVGPATVWKMSRRRRATLDCAFGWPKRRRRRHCHRANGLQRDRGRMG